MLSKKKNKKENERKTQNWKYNIVHISAFGVCRCSQAAHAMC